MSSYREQGVIFDCGASRLVGIAAIPPVVSDVGVLILVGGPQYRVGSHRQFTLLARSMAEEGIPSLRFDYTGMGDSEGGRREFDQTQYDIAAAIDALLETIPGVQRVILWGLCDAASSAMMFAHRNARVAGMILLNPWVHTGEYSPEVKLAHYYRPSFSRMEQWRRLLYGEIKLFPAFRELSRNVLALLGNRTPRVSTREPHGAFVGNMLEGLQRFRHDALIVLSEADLTAREFSTLIANSSDWKDSIAKSTITINTVQAADHTFSQRPWQESVTKLTIDWVKLQVR